MSTTCAMAQAEAEARAAAAAAAAADVAAEPAQGLVQGRARVGIPGGCRLANITARWLGHFDYRPVIGPAVFAEVASAAPGKLWHPVKAAKPLSSAVMDHALAAAAAAAGTALSPASMDQAVLLAPPRAYKPASYFLSGRHEAWKPKPRERKPAGDGAQ